MTDAKRKEYKREYYKKNKARSYWSKPKTGSEALVRCADCGFTFSGHLLTKRCKPCAADRLKKKEKLRRDTVPAQERKQKARATRVNWYGITTDEFAEISKVQGGVCAGCKRPPTNRSLSVDHKHQRNDKKVGPAMRRNMVRGLLCHRCNRAVGMLGDKVDTLRNLVNYLDSPPAVKILLTSAAAVLGYLQKHEERTQANAG